MLGRWDDRPSDPAYYIEDCWIFVHCGNKFQWLKKIKGNAPAKYIQAKAQGPAQRTDTAQKYVLRIWKDSRYISPSMTEKKVLCICNVSSLINGYSCLLFSRRNSILPVNFHLTNWKFIPIFTNKQAGWEKFLFITLGQKFCLLHE